MADRLVWRIDRDLHTLHDNQASASEADNTDFYRRLQVHSLGPISTILRKYKVIEAALPARVKLARGGLDDAVAADYDNALACPSCGDELLAISGSNHRRSASASSSS